MGAITSQIASLTIVYLPAQMASNAENVSIWWHHHVNDDLNYWRLSAYMDD